MAEWERRPGSGSDEKSSALRHTWWKERTGSCAVTSTYAPWHVPALLKEVTLIILEPDRLLAAELSL